MKTRTQKLNTLTFSILIALAAGCASESPEPIDSQPTDTVSSAVIVPEPIINGVLPADAPVLAVQDEATIDQAAPPVKTDFYREKEEIHSYEIKRANVNAPQTTGLSRAMPASLPRMQMDSIRMPAERLYSEQYEHPGDQQTVRVSDVPVSTFSIDVDTGSYSNMRRWVSQGQLPPEDAVRAEEFINYFDYRYEVPDETEQPFSVNTEIAQTPWNAATYLVRIGIQGYKVPHQALPSSNLVFLVDVSGSMQSADKLPLLKQALSMLTRKLDANDTISMVVYAGASGVVLDSVAGNQGATILAALQQLEAGGSTNGAAGIQLAYQLARQNFKADGVNRVILATDGDFNVGVASTQELKDMIERQRKSGIALTTLGFGSGNYNDHMLEQLADAGNGNHAYIDRLSEAQKVLSEEMSSTLLTIAKDVKIQLEFNPNTVSEYRLIGYENRVLNEEDFNNDQVDAGDIGAGHTVTALYEINLVGSDFQRLPSHRYNHSSAKREKSFAYTDELAHLRIRYKLPGEGQSKLIQTPILANGFQDQNEQGSDDFRFAAAVAAFAQKLRGGKYLESYSYSDIRQLASQSRGEDPFAYRGEFLQLVSLADSLTPPDTTTPEELAMDR
jgi:Ca-activated chloride channel family protein